MRVPSPSQSLREANLPAEVICCLCTQPDPGPCVLFQSQEMPSTAGARDPEPPAAGCHRRLHQGNGLLPPAAPASLPCTPLAPVINQAPYLLRPHLHSCNPTVEMFAVTISCEGGFPSERYRCLSRTSFQVEARCPSPSPEGKTAKTHRGKRGKNCY